MDTIEEMLVSILFSLLDLPCGLCNSKEFIFPLKELELCVCHNSTMESLAEYLLICFFKNFKEVLGTISVNQHLWVPNLCII